jgi:hypothetical protein
MRRGHTMLVKEFQQPQKFETTLREIVSAVLDRREDPKPLIRALVQSIGLEGTTDAAQEPLSNCSVQELVDITITTGALSAETLLTVIDATEGEGPDNPYCIVCGAEAMMHSEHCPIPEALCVIGFRTLYICAGCGDGMLRPYRHEGSFWCRRCYPRKVMVKSKRHARLKPRTKVRVTPTEEGSSVATPEFRSTL